MCRLDVQKLCYTVIPNSSKITKHNNYDYQFLSFVKRSWPITYHKKDYGLFLIGIYVGLEKGDRPRISLYAGFWVMKQHVRRTNPLVLFQSLAVSSLFLHFPSWQSSFLCTGKASVGPQKLFVRITSIDLGSFDTCHKYIKLTYQIANYNYFGIKPSARKYVFDFSFHQLPVVLRASGNTEIVSATSCVLVFDILLKRFVKKNWIKYDS